MDLESVRRSLLAFRARYLQVELTIDFYAVAINTRTGSTIGGPLRACDTLAHRSMAQLLDQLGKPTPIVLTYVDKGLGASILKAGLRLWDRTSIQSRRSDQDYPGQPIRPTAWIYEACHQNGAHCGLDG